MKNWNRTGKIKAIILAVLCIPNLIYPPQGGMGEGLGFVLIMPLVFGAFAIPLISKFNQGVFGQELTPPHWNENPLRFSKPTVFWQFGGFFFLSNGFAMILGTLIQNLQINRFGLLAVSFGLGILIGVELTLRWNRKSSE